MLYVVVLLTWFTLSDANTSTSAIISTNIYGGNQDVCQLWKNMTKQQICDYVNSHHDICEGGGYLLWSQYVECEFDMGKKVAIIIAGFLWMLMLFVMVSTTANDFFSTSVASIVAHLKISESIAGVTFLAFGNGAPDIFGSIASVLSTKKPKAGLALGELFGAGIFVTTVVTASIVLVRPFKIDTFSTIRDLIFFLIALGWILFVFLHSNQLFIWEPAGYLGLYGIYLVTVIVGHQLHKQKRKRQHGSTDKHGFSDVVSRKRSVHPAVPEIHIISDTVEKIQAINGNTLNIFPAITFDKTRSTIGDKDENNSESEENSEEEFIVSHNQVYTGTEARSRATSLVPPPIEVVSIRTWFYDIYKHFQPLPNDWSEQDWFAKILSVMKMPFMLVLKMTIPLNEMSWSKSVAFIQAICAPQWFLFAVQLSFLQPFDDSPGLYAYAFMLSAIIIVLLAVFTTMGKQPRYYKEVSSYLGFLMSIAWIYFVSSEIVNVVTMFGIISQISHEVLGLTILAWSNSISDLIADISVVRQGYPRMAMAAAVGGPLFNLLIGFGLSFFIAKASGRTVTIEFNPTYKILILFLGISLTTTLIACFVQRFYLRRPYAFVLILIYLAFMAMIILTETNVLVWN